MTLPPGGFKQFNGILASNGLSLANGYVRVERVGGSAPYAAYAVINDQANSDGSWVSAVPADTAATQLRLALPTLRRRSRPTYRRRRVRLGGPVTVPDPASDEAGSRSPGGIGLPARPCSSPKMTFGFVDGSAIASRNMLSGVASGGGDWKGRLKALGLGRKRRAPGEAPAALRDRTKLDAGEAGEAMAAGYLAEHGLRVLARNVRYRNGELDLVAEDGPALVFVEVRRRRTAERGGPAESVTRAKAGARRPRRPALARREPALCAARDPLRRRRDPGRALLARLDPGRVRCGLRPGEAVTASECRLPRSAPGTSAGSGASPTRGRLDL